MIGKRIEEIDTAKGIGILCVMFGHCITLMSNPVNVFVLSFHMPLFFFLSGMVLNKEQPTKVFIKRKIKSLGTAMIAAYGMYILMGWLVDVFWLKNESIVTFDYVRGLNNWFIITLCISIIAVKVVNKRKIYVFTVVLAYLLFLKFRGGTYVPYMYIEQSLLAYVFISLGLLLGEKLMEIMKNNKAVCFENGMVFFVILNFIAQYNGPCAMAANMYGKNKIFFTITSVLGIIAVLNISMCGIKSELLDTCGRNSMIIFVTHFSALKLITSIWTEISKYQYVEYPWYIIVFTILLMVELGIIWLFKKCQMGLENIRYYKDE